MYMVVGGPGCCVHGCKRTRSLCMVEGGLGLAVYGCRRVMF